MDSELDEINEKLGQLIYDIYNYLPHSHDIKELTDTIGKLDADIMDFQNLYAKQVEILEELVKAYINQQKELVFAIKEINKYLDAIIEELGLLRKK